MTQQDNEWGWYASPDGDDFDIGPVASRDSIIEAAKAAGYGDGFYIMEAQPPRTFRVADYFFGYGFLEQACDALADNGHITGEDVGISTTPEQNEDLQLRVREVIEAWQDHHGIVVKSSFFAAQGSTEHILHLTEGVHS